ncbi:MAG: orotidine 5'-phosphate decarboxylase [Gemmatales bacterium]|nr:MAG: orotidine 5'-phosphate decarboxylase [Gemmatales bacterium]
MTDPIRTISPFADRLAAEVRRKRNSLCVGIDPRWERLPTELKRRHGDGTLSAVARAYEEFGARILDVVAKLVPIVKLQSAFFEACGPEGFRAQARLLQRARRLGLMTILDAKRNDIASTAAAYADAAFAGSVFDGQVHPVWQADALTVNPYLGRDAVEPFLQSARRFSGGLFVLVRTSNPGAGQFQDLPCDGKPLYLHVAEAVGAWNRENVGQCGFGDVGAVVGATHPSELAAVRRALGEVWLLLPGYGAQGATADDLAPAFRSDGLGAVVNSSRGILFAYEPDERDWESAVKAATEKTIADLQSTTPMAALARD